MIQTAHHVKLRMIEYGMIWQENAFVVTDTTMTALRRNVRNAITNVENVFKQPLQYASSLIK